MGLLPVLVKLAPNVTISTFNASIQQNKVRTTYAQRSTCTATRLSMGLLVRLTPNVGIPTFNASIHGRIRYAQRMHNVQRAQQLTITTLLVYL
jgi:hypothetical protein